MGHVWNKTNLDSPVVFNYPHIFTNRISASVLCSVFLSSHPYTVICSLFIWLLRCSSILPLVPWHQTFSALPCKHANNLRGCLLFDASCIWCFALSKETLTEGQTLIQTQTFETSLRLPSTISAHGSVWAEACREKTGWRERVLRWVVGQSVCSLQPD